MRDDFTSSTEQQRRVLSAFTLVELLVVIAIIAMLVSVLLPALKNARDSGKQVNCASGMRQTALAALIYTTEYKEKLPPFNNNGPPWYAQYIYVVMAPYLSIQWETEWATQSSFLAWRKGRNVYCCPSISPDEQDSLLPDGSIWTYYYSTYGYNLNISTDANVNFRRITEYEKKLSVSVLYYEWRVKQVNEGGSFTWDPFISSPVWMTTGWSQFIIDKPAHNGRNYFSFMDGHVQGVKTRPTYSDYISSDMQWVP